MQERRRRVVLPCALLYFYNFLIISTRVLKFFVVCVLCISFMTAANARPLSVSFTYCITITNTFVNKQSSLQTNAKIVELCCYCSCKTVAVQTNAQHRKVVN